MFFFLSRRASFVRRPRQQCYYTIHAYNNIVMTLFIPCRLSRVEVEAPILPEVRNLTFQTFSRVRSFDMAESYCHVYELRGSPWTGDENNAFSKHKWWLGGRIVQVAVITRFYFQSISVDSFQDFDVNRHISIQTNGFISLRVRPHLIIYNTYFSIYTV